MPGEITLDNQPLKEELIRFVPVDGKLQPADASIIAGQFKVTVQPGAREKRFDLQSK